MGKIALVFEGKRLELDDKDIELLKKIQDESKSRDACCDLWDEKYHYLGQGTPKGVQLSAFFKHVLGIG